MYPLAKFSSMYAFSDSSSLGVRGYILQFNFLWGVWSKFDREVLLSFWGKALGLLIREYLPVLLVFFWDQHLFYWVEGGDCSHFCFLVLLSSEAVPSCQDNHWFSFQFLCFPVNLWVLMFEPWVTKDHPVFSKACNEELECCFLFSSLYP